MYKNLNNQSQGTDNCAVQEITYGQINNQYVVDLENKTDPDRLAQINCFFVFSYRDYTKDSLGMIGLKNDIQAQLFIIIWQKFLTQTFLFFFLEILYYSNHYLSEQVSLPRGRQVCRIYICSMYVAKSWHFQTHINGLDRRNAV